MSGKHVPAQENAFGMRQNVQNESLGGPPLTGQAWTLKPLRLGASKGLLPRFGPQTAYSVLKISRAA